MAPLSGLITSLFFLLIALASLVNPQPIDDDLSLDFSEDTSTPAIISPGSDFDEGIIVGETPSPIDPLNFDQTSLSLPSGPDSNPLDEPFSLASKSQYSSAVCDGEFRLLFCCKSLTQCASAHGETCYEPEFLACCTWEMYTQTSNDCQAIQVDQSVLGGERGLWDIWTGVWGVL